MANVPSEHMSLEECVQLMCVFCFILFFPCLLWSHSYHPFLRSSLRFLVFLLYHQSCLGICLKPSASKALFPQQLFSLFCRSLGSMLHDMQDVLVSISFLPLFSFYSLMLVCTENERLYK